jgi:hypothetical protein
MATVSEIKLIRTDTTLDLSQKAEKVWGRREILTAYNQFDIDRILLWLSGKWITDACLP